MKRTGLEIGGVVSELRALRLKSLENRQRRDRPPKLPSRKVLVGIADGLGAVLFPNRLGMPDLTNESVDYYVGHTLDVTLRELMVQVRRELRFAGDADAPGNSERERQRELRKPLPKGCRIYAVCLKATFRQPMKETRLHEA